MQAEADSLRRETVSFKQLFPAAQNIYNIIWQLNQTDAGVFVTLEISFFSATLVNSHPCLS